MDDNSEAVVVDIERDNWVPRIELQGMSFVFLRGIYVKYYAAILKSNANIDLCELFN